MLTLPVIALFLGTLALWWWLNRDDKLKGFKAIPGPMGLPVFGNVFQVGDKMHLQFSKWATKYGKIFRIQLGNRRAIVISDPKWIKEIFSNDPAFTGRQIFEGFEMYTNEPLGIASTEGELWEVHRRFLLRQLRDFGFGKSSMEERVMEEIKETLERLKTLSGKPVDNMKDIFKIAVVNSLWTIVGSKRFPHDDPQMLEMTAESEAIMKQIMKRAVTLFLPWTRHFFPEIKGLKEVQAKGIKFYSDIVNEHKETYQEDAPRDFIDVYLKEMEANKTDSSSMFYGSRAERQLHAILADLFFAGTDTTSSTLSYAVLYLTKFPHVQQKFKEEISRATGNSRHVSLSDRPNMPYTMAMIEEVFRMSSILASGVQHMAMADREFKGFLIPKGTWIFPNLYHMHRDPKLWDESEKFMPERFLSQDGKTFKKSENLMPFQIGRRQCVGETLARDNVFLFLTNIFQQFSIRLNPNSPEPSFEPELGFVLAPVPYSVVLEDSGFN